ncbi:hypothetical protein VCHC17A1_3905A, partial [Vibrio cholerae HC-17A1]
MLLITGDVKLPTRS